MMSRIFTSLILTSVLVLSLQSAPREWAKARTEIQRGLQKKDILERMKAVEELSEQDNADAAKFILDLITKEKKVDNSLKVRAAEILSGYKNEEARKLLAAYIAKDAYCDLLVFDAIARMGIAEARPIFTDILKNPKKNKAYDIYYPLAIKAMGFYPDQDDNVIRLIELNLDARKPHAVRKAACEALGGIKNVACMKILVQHLNDLALQYDAADSLMRLTGEDFGCDAEKWRKFIEEKGAGFVPLNLSRKEIAEARANKLKEGEGEAGAPQAGSSFYGIALKGENAYFILDRSGSMDSKQGSFTRMEKLKEEFNKLIGAMQASGKKHTFGVAFFPGMQRFPAKGMCALDEASIGDFQKFMKSITSGGDTPLKGAMKYFFDEIADKADVDTVYLLSDGEPTDAPPYAIPGDITVWNLGRNIRINTVSIGLESDMMKSIAGMNGGEYRSVR